MRKNFSLFTILYICCGLSNIGHAWEVDVQHENFGIEVASTDLPAGAIVQMDADEEARFFDELDAYFDGESQDDWTFEVDDNYDYFVEDQEETTEYDYDVET